MSAMSSTNHDEQPSVQRAESCVKSKQEASKQATSEMRRIDVDAGDGEASPKKARAAAGSVAKLRSSLSWYKKGMLVMSALLCFAWMSNAGLVVAVVLAKDTKVVDGSLKNTDGGSVSTHNQKTTYSISQDFEKNASESRRRLQAGGSVQVAAITCPVVRQAIKSIQDGDNEGAVEMALGGGFFTASVTANFYHAEVTSGTFGIERIHLDGNLDVAYAVECEEASCNVAGYKCPVLGLAVGDEGRRRLVEDEEKCLECINACPACEKLLFAESCWKRDNCREDCFSTPPCECFPSASTVTLADGITHLRMDELRHGDVIRAVTRDGKLTTDTVSFLSLANADAVGIFVRITTEDGTVVTLTPGHRLPVSEACCGTLKLANDVDVGDTIWVAASEDDAAPSPQRVAATALVEAKGKHSPVLSHGSFPLVQEACVTDTLADVPLTAQNFEATEPIITADAACTRAGVVTAFDSIGYVDLASYALPLLEPVCKAMGLCSAVRRALFSRPDGGYVQIAESYQIGNLGDDDEATTGIQVLQ